MAGCGVAAAVIGVVLGGGLLYLTLPVVSIGLAASQSTQVVLRGHGLVHRTAVEVATERLAMVGTFLFSLLLPVTPAFALPVCLGIGGVVAAVVGWFLTPPQWRLRFVRPRLNPWQGCRTYGVFMAAVTLQTVDLPVLSLVGGSSAAGARTGR